MNSMWKRSFALLLSMVLVFGMIPANAFATEGGEHTHVYVEGACECGAVEPAPVQDAEAPAHTHDFGEGTVTTAATCAAAGVLTKSCACGETITEVIAATGEHVYENGACACGAADPNYQPPAHTHDFGEGTVTTVATCAAAGVLTKTCACGETATEVIPATGNHNYVDGVCTVCTAVEPDAQPDEPVHTHEWNEGVVTTEAICTDAGVMTYTCQTEDCGETKTETIPAQCTDDNHAWECPFNLENPTNRCTLTEGCELVKNHPGECTGMSTLEVPEFPNATVTKLDQMTLDGGSYMAWPSGDTAIDCPLDIVMNFKANDTLEEAQAGGYGKWITDFYITFDGLTGGTLTTDDDTYLAGNYGGWIVIPAKALGEELSEDTPYPVVAAYDPNLTYEEICKSVKDFTAAIHISDDLLEKHPNIEITLELKMTNPDDSEDVYTVGGYTYDKSDLRYVSPVSVKVPGNVELDADVKTSITNNDAVNDQELHENFGEASLVITVESNVKEDNDIETIAYEVAPMLDGEKVQPTGVVTFRLPVPANFAGNYAKVQHNGVDHGIYPILKDGNDRYVEITTDSFSVYSLKALNYVAVIDETGYETLAEALNTAKSGETIELIWEEGYDPIVMTGEVTGGKTVTIIGTATVDWSKDWLFVGRGSNPGDGKLIFKDTKLISASHSNATYGLNVSGATSSSTTNNGTVVMQNSNIQLDYLNSKGTVEIDGGSLIVYNGFSVTGRMASESVSGSDDTATLTAKNDAVLTVGNLNGGIGYEGNGVLNINGATFNYTRSSDFELYGKGTININGGTVNITGGLNNGANININGGNLTVGGTLNNAGTVYVTGTSDIDAKVSGNGWIYVNGVTMSNKTKLTGAKVGFINGTSNVVGSTFQNGWFNVGIGKDNAEEKAATAAANFAAANGIPLGDVTVNVSGNAIISPAGKTYNGWVGSAYSADKTVNKYTLNVTNSLATFGYMHVSKDGTLNVTGHSTNKYTYDNASVDFYAGELIINGVATFDGTDAWGKFNKISVDHEGGVLNIKNGSKYEASCHNGGGEGDTLVFWGEKPGTVNVDASTLEIDNITTINAASALNVTNGGKIIATGEIKNAGVLSAAIGTEMKATNISGAGTVRVDGTGFTGGEAESPYGTSNIVGFTGKIDSNSGMLFPARKVIVENTTHYVVLETAVAKVGEQYFASLQGAIDAADGKTVTLMKNAEVTDRLTVAAGKNVIFDLNTKVLTTPGINNEGTLDIKNGTVIGNSTSHSTIESTGSLIVTNVTASGMKHVLRPRAGTATINSGTFTVKCNDGAGTAHVMNVGDDDDRTAATVTVNGGTFIGANNAEANCDSGSAIMVQYTSEVTVKGGTFTKGKNELLKKEANAKLTLTGGTYDQDPREFCAPEYAPKKDGNVYIVVKAGASVTANGKTSYFYSLAEAAEAAKTMPGVTEITQMNDDNQGSNAEPVVVPGPVAVSGLGLSGNLGVEIGAGDTVSVAKSGEITVSAADDGDGYGSVVTVKKDSKGDLIKQTVFVLSQTKLSVKADTTGFGDAEFAGEYMKDRDGDKALTGKDFDAYLPTHDNRYVKGTDETLIVESTGFFDTCARILVGDIEVYDAKDNYKKTGVEVKVGCTRLELTSKFLKTLSTGDYKVTFVHEWNGKDVKVSETIKIRTESKADTSNPKTGDFIMVPVAVMAMSATALAVLLMLNKKKHA